METKVCSKCKKELNVSKFNKCSSEKSGLYSSCRECVKIRKKELGYLLKDGEYKNKNMEYKNSNMKWCNLCKREYLRTSEYFYKDNVQKDGFSCMCKKCKSKKTREYKKTEKGRLVHKVSEYKRRSEVINKNHFIKKIEWDKIKKYFNNGCAYCGKEDKITLDHFVAIKSNGDTSINNIIPACGNCNSSKRDKSFFKWYPTYKHYSKKREQKILKFLGYKDAGVQQLKLML